MFSLQNRCPLCVYALLLYYKWVSLFKADYLDSLGHWAAGDHKKQLSALIEAQVFMSLKNWYSSSKWAVVLLRLVMGLLLSWPGHVVDRQGG